MNIKIEDIRLTKRERELAENKYWGDSSINHNISESYDAIANTATEKAVKKIVAEFDAAEINPTARTRMPDYEKTIEALKKLVEGEK